MELSLVRPRRYRVKRGQSLQSIAQAFGVTPRLLAAHNHLTEEPVPGQLLTLPAAGALYTVQGGESKTLLCGSPARFEARNATTHLYPMQTVLL